MLMLAKYLASGSNRAQAWADTSFRNKNIIFDRKKRNIICIGFWQVKVAISITKIISYVC